MRRSIRLLLFCTLFCFATSVFVHISTFFGVEYSNVVFVLHVGIFALLFAASAVCKRGLSLNPSDVPGPAWLLLISLFIYYGLTFFYIMSANQMGVPSDNNGRYVLESHGKIICELSEADYRIHMGYVMRGFSGLWMVFYFLIACVLWKNRKG